MDTGSPAVRLTNLMSYPVMGTCHIWSGTSIITIAQRQNPSFLTANWGDLPA